MLPVAAARRVILSSQARTIFAQALCALVPLAAAAQAAPAPADLLVTHALIHTADSLRPRAEALAIRAGRIVFVGRDAEAAPFRGPRTRVLDARGKTIVPGLIDAHAHLMGLGLALATVDLTGTRSYAEVIERVAARARTTPRGQWVVGRGWDQNDWAEKVFPSHEALSRAVPEHPVLLTRVDGHALLANARAMRRAGVTAATKDPDGGRIERDAAGHPLGVFVDAAEGLIERAVPAPTRAQRRAMLLAALRDVNRWGLTGLADAGVTRDELAVYEQVAREGKYTLRNAVMVAGRDPASVAAALARGPQQALYDGRLWIRNIKYYMDGALGSRGAALLEPYSDDTANRGLLLTTPDALRAATERALRRGFQVSTHAIGDRANRLVLDVYAAALKAVPVRDARLRIEHAQILDPADIPRFRALGVIPSMQATHETSDAPWAGTRLGERRLAGAYAWASLLRTGVIIPNGTDFPVEAVNPMLTFHASVTRQDERNQPPGGWRPEERMTREQALRSMTLWAAIANFQEREIGSLEVGKYGDFVLLDRDLMTVPPEQLAGTKVLATYLGGVAVYEAR